MTKIIKRLLVGGAVTVILFISFFNSLLFVHHEKIDHDDKNSRDHVEEIDVGVIVDLGSWEGRSLHRCIGMAISEFDSMHGNDHKTRLVLHTANSKGDPLLALSSAIDLLKKYQVKAIIGAQTSMEAKFLAEFGDKTEIPVISFSPHTTSPSSFEHLPYFVQVSQHETSHAEGTANIVAAFGWRDVIIVYEDSDDWNDFVPHLVDSLRERHVNVAYKASFVFSSFKEVDKIIEGQLHELMLSFEQTVFIVHMSPSLTTRLFETAKELGMMGIGYAWIMTVKSMNHFSSIRSLSYAGDSMHGVIGLRSYIPASKELHNFTSRWRNLKFLGEQDMELNVLCIWAYDVAWGLAKAAEKLVSPSISTSRQHGSILMKEILQLKFKGLSGEFQFVNKKLFSNAFEIVNVLARGERRVGFWTSGGRINQDHYSSTHGRLLSSSGNDGGHEDIIWPGGYSTIPKGYVAKKNPKKLRLAVPYSGFHQLLNMDSDLNNKETIATGFCIDVFKAAIRALPYEVDYEFIPFVFSNGNIDNGSYEEIVEQIYFQKYDGAVGDITITANRSLYVDFTLPYTDLGVGMVAPKETTNSMWIFMKPLKADLWLSSAGLFVMTGFVIWLIERPINNEFQGSISQQIGMALWFSFSTLVFAHREKLMSNLSRFVMIVWVFIVLILTSSYTATLTSMITVQQFQLNSKGNYMIWYPVDVLAGGVISNLNFKNINLQPFESPEGYADALSRGSKKGGVAAIIDEIPYIKIFLAKYSADYSMVGTMPITNGFAFAFRKGSPLVSDLSRMIAEMRQNKTLITMENLWFKNSSVFTSEETSNDVKPLTIKNFRGLFLISGVSLGLSLAIFCSFLIHKNWHVIRNCNLRDLVFAKLNFVRDYLISKILFSRM